MKVSCEVSSYIFDLETGKRESPIFTRPANSFLANFLKRQFAMWANSTYVGEVDTSGTARTNAIFVNYYLNAGVAGTTYGILVGTGTNAVSIDDYKLVAATAGSFGYGPTCLGFEVDATASRIIVWRTFNNLIGQTVEIKEVGLQASNQTDSRLYLQDRTLYNISVPDRKGCYISYIISFTM